MGQLALAGRAHERALEMALPPALLCQRLGLACELLDVEPVRRLAGQPPVVIVDVLLPGNCLKGGVQAPRVGAHARRTVDVNTGAPSATLHFRSGRQPQRERDLSRFVSAQAPGGVDDLRIGEGLADIVLKAALVYAVAIRNGAQPIPERSRRVRAEPAWLPIGWIVTKRSDEPDDP